jgi:glycosyltransferase involved in cell wall biosynthesis
MTIKLAIITETFPPDLCGVADYVEIIAKELAITYEVYIITRKLKQINIYDLQNIKIYEIMNSKFYILKVISYLKKIKPDIIDIQLSYSLASKLHKMNIFTLINSSLLKLTLPKTKLVCTVHELSYLCEFLKESKIRRLYRKIRDYCNTRFFDYYFCLNKVYLNYFTQTSKKEFIENFSNIPTLRECKFINSYNILFFGIITSNKNIEKLSNLFKILLKKNQKFHLFLVGGIVKDYQKKFEQIMADLPNTSWDYLEKLNFNELKIILNQCSYAIFPFKVSDKNASVLAMLVNGLIVIAECDSTPEYSKYGNNFYGMNELDVESVYQVISSTFGSQVEYTKNQELIQKHITRRKVVYENILQFKHK